MSTTTAQTGPAWLHKKIQAGETIIIDGATSTELERRGVPMNEKAWSGDAMLFHGGTLKGVHEDYIRAGAQVIITNTFASSRHVLEPAGLGDEVEKVNTLAVDIARCARDVIGKRNIAIAGSISDFRPRADNGKWTNESTLRATYREQAEILAEAGVDLLAMEMMQEPEIAVPAIESALATGLPVWIGVSCRIIEDMPRLAMFDDPEREFGECLRAVTAMGAGVINIMHSNLPDTARGIDELRELWEGPIGVYPNSGYFKMPNWQFIDIVPVDDFVNEAARWRMNGVQLFGGCCGIGPDHIKALSAAFI